MRLQDFLHQVYLPAKLEELSAPWIKHLECTIRQFDRYTGGAEIDDLSDSMVCDFLRHMKQHGNGPVTVNDKRAQLLALWRCAWRKHMHAELPRDVPRCREPQAIPRAWTSSEVQRLVTHAAALRGLVGGLPASWWWATLILCIWETGVRVGAALSMMPADFLPGGPALLAQETEGKTLLGQCLPLSPPTATALAGHLFPDRDRIWPWPYSDVHLFRRFRRIVEGAGLTASRRGHDLFHKLRRSHISYVARESLELARAQAGHTSAAVTLRYYVDPIIAGGTRAVDLLPKIEIRSTRQKSYTFPRGFTTA